MIRRLPCATACALGLALAWPAAVWPRDLAQSEDSERWLRLRSSLKGTDIFSHAPDDLVLFPERTSASSLWRLRLEPEGRPVPWLTATLAYEQRMQLVSSGAGLGGGTGLLPSEGPAPFRIWQLDESVGGSGTLIWRQEIDRASVAAQLPFGEATVGRQAIGWGRGTLFSAVDTFSPFTPLQVDREWRRGVDALRADLRLGKQASIDAVAAFGPTLGESAFAARLRGYAGEADAELVGGRRSQDMFLGATASGVVGEGELHGEVAFFWLPQPWIQSGTFGDDHLVVKALAGGSIRLPVGSGLKLLLEYHYSGFGAQDTFQLTSVLLNPVFIERLQHGDTQILGRNAIGLLANYETGMTTTVFLQWLQDPTDSSGVVSPTLSWDMAESVTVLFGVYLSYGVAPQAGEIHSQFGVVPLSGIIQVRLYD